MCPVLLYDGGTEGTLGEITWAGHSRNDFERLRIMIGASIATAEYVTISALTDTTYLSKTICTGSAGSISTKIRSAVYNLTDTSIMPVAGRSATATITSSGASSATQAHELRIFSIEGYHL